MRFGKATPALSSPRTISTFISIGAGMNVSQVDANKAVIRRLVEAHNRQDAFAAAACFAPGGTNHGRVAGPSGMERVYRNLYAAFPDYHWELQTLFGEGDWVALHVVQTGTHLGTLELPVFGGLIHNVAPTGKTVSVANIHLYQMRDGLIVRHTAVRDDLGMMRQMGLLPETQHAGGDMSRPDR
ncbi:ester cyclase [Bradyrhizobium sp.]|uniref:ester cyclase n=1 Tax=Bradyrhizobium sp. TaxID=376 RepID=UPI003C5D19F8